MRIQWRARTAALGLAVTAAIELGAGAPLPPAVQAVDRAAAPEPGAEELRPRSRRTGPALGAAVASFRSRADTLDGAAVYRAACANCHGDDGRGAPATQVAFEIPLPDFSDCNFAAREPDADWVAVGHEGGPTRGFARMMPAFGQALSVPEIQAAVDHIRTFCGDDGWPRGELNLPRAMITEKAYPEDEAVFTVTSALEGRGDLGGELTYEKRFGARDQLELVVPFSLVEVARTAGDGSPGDGGEGATEWNAGLGDVALGWKHVLFHSLESGSILSVTGEVILPTGDESDGFGKGTTVFEPFLSAGQILPGGAFLQAQGGFEIPADGDLGEEAFWRGVLGKTFTSGRWGRAWSPMIEVLGARELASGETTHWDLLPQMQVTLNTRQHVMANIGVRIPLNDTEARATELLVYVLWDYFDGGFFAGW